jgi:hypothetical protein
MARGRLLVLSLPLLVVGAVCAAACSSETSAPLGMGDRVFVDVDSSSLPPARIVDADLSDSPFARVDGSEIYGTYNGNYAVMTVCQPPDGSAGGAETDATVHAREGGAAAPADGAAPASSAADGATTAPYAGGDAAGACVPFPAACASTPDCMCLFKAFAAQIPCPYPSCGVQSLTIFCPPP